MKFSSLEFIVVVVVVVVVVIVVVVFSIDKKVFEAKYF